MQAFPHAPQFCTSLFRSTHEPSHEVAAPHSLAQLPA
jgi:hypothetical protein